MNNLHLLCFVKRYHYEREHLTMNRSNDHNRASIQDGSISNHSRTKFLT